MNEELQGKLLEILSAIQAGARTAGDFALEQLPGIAQQYVVYGRSYETIVFTAWFVAFCLSVWVACRHGYFARDAVEKPTTHTDGGDWLTSRLAAAFGGSAMALIFGVITLVNLQDVVLVWLAPKVWLLKEIAWLLK